MADGPIQNVDWPRTILMASGIFAVGAVGFFLAVLLQNYGSSAAPASLPQASVEQKTDVLNSLNATSSVSPSAPAAGASSSASEAISPSQADQSDQNAAAKLNVLNALNSQ